MDIAPERRDVTVIAVRASDIAAELGDVRAANMVALGAYLKARGAVSRETVVDSIRAVMPRLSQDLIDLNVKAIDKGMDIAGDQLMISESIS